jgi:predicted  nucleic acid-binding Zn-ribbon protein
MYGVYGLIIYCPMILTGRFVKAQCDAFNGSIEERLEEYEVHKRGALKELEDARREASELQVSYSQLVDTKDAYYLQVNYIELNHKYKKVLYNHAGCKTAREFSALEDALQTQKVSIRVICMTFR